MPHPTYFSQWGISLSSVALSFRKMACHIPHSTPCWVCAPEIDSSKPGKFHKLACRISNFALCGVDLPKTRNQWCKRANQEPQKAQKKASRVFDMCPGFWVHIKNLESLDFVYQVELSAPRKSSAFPRSRAFAKCPRRREKTATLKQA